MDENLDIGCREIHSVWKGFNGFVNQQDGGCSVPILGSPITTRVRDLRKLSSKPPRRSSRYFRGVFHKCSS